MKQKFLGIVWCLMGMVLLYKGVHFLSEQPLLIAPGLLIGFLKGRFVLSKTVKRMILTPPPVLAYLGLVGVMAAFGFLLSFFPDPVRGTIDVAVGSALLYGSALFIGRIGSPAQSP